MKTWLAVLGATVAASPLLFAPSASLSQATSYLSVDIGNAPAPTSPWPANSKIPCVQPAGGTPTFTLCSVAPSAFDNTENVIPLALTWAPGINPNNLPMANLQRSYTIVGIRCTPEVLAGGAATIQPVVAPSATAISSGANLTSNTCNANSGAATNQDLTLSVTTLSAGQRIGIKTTGTTIWTTNGVAAGVITVFVRVP